jgi:hypothetical protein
MLSNNRELALCKHFLFLLYTNQKKGTCITQAPFKNNSGFIK